MEKKWFNKTIKDVEKELQTDLVHGLNKNKVNELKSKYGLNELKEKKKDSLLKKFIDQFKDFSIIVLIIAAIVSGIVGVVKGEGITDTIIIMIVVILILKFVLMIYAMLFIHLVLQVSLKVLCLHMVI